MAFRTSGNGVSTTSTTSPSQWGLQTWTWGFWFRRISNPGTNSTVIASGPNGAATVRDLRLQTDGTFRVFLNGTGTDPNRYTSAAVSTSWEFYCITVDWAVNPRIDGYVSAMPGDMAAISWGAYTHGTGSLNTESTTQITLMNNSAASLPVNVAAMGPFCLWSRVLTLEQSQQVLRYGPLAQPSGLLLWVHPYEHVYGNADWAGTGATWSGWVAQHTYESEPPSIWLPRR